MKENISTELIGEFKSETIRQLDRYMHFLTHNFIQNNLDMFKRMGLGEPQALRRRTATRPDTPRSATAPGAGTAL